MGDHPHPEERQWACTFDVWVVAEGGEDWGHGVEVRVIDSETYAERFTWRFYVYSDDFPVALLLAWARFHKKWLAQYPDVEVYEVQLQLESAVAAEVRDE